MVCEQYVFIFYRLPVLSCLDDSWNNFLPLHEKHRQINKTFRRLRLLLTQSTSVFTLRSLAAIPLPRTASKAQGGRICQHLWRPKTFLMQWLDLKPLLKKDTIAVALSVKAQRYFLATQNSSSHVNPQLVVTKPSFVGLLKNMANASMEKNASLLMESMNYGVWSAIQSIKPSSAALITPAAYVHTDLVVILFIIRTKWQWIPNGSQSV